MTDVICVPASDQDRERFRFSSHLELLYASDQILHAQAEKMKNTEVSVIKEIESLYSNAVSVIREGEDVVRETMRNLYRV